jgi:hypothetical protein
MKLCVQQFLAENALQLFKVDWNGNIFRKYLRQLLRKLKQQSVDIPLVENELDYLMVAEYLFEEVVMVRDF